jgi:hypothetical protein
LYTNLVQDIVLEAASGLHCIFPISVNALSVLMRKADFNRHVQDSLPQFYDPLTRRIFPNIWLFEGKVTNKLVFMLLMSVQRGSRGFK